MHCTMKKKNTGVLLDPVVFCFQADAERILECAAALAIMFLLASQSAYSAVCVWGECSEMTTEFRTLEMRPKSIALLPARSSLTENGVFNSESRVGETAPLENYLAISLEEEFKSRGYEVRSLTVDEIAEDQQLADLVNAANQRYYEEYATIVAFKVTDIKYRRYSVGEESRLLANYLGVDAVAFPRMQINGASSASKWMGNLGVKQETQAGIYMEFGLVHARTGDIEAFFGGVSGGVFKPSFKKILKKAKKYMANIAKVATKQMPEVDAALEPEDIDADKVVRELVVYDPVDEASVLDDLEDLLGDDDMFAEEAPADEVAPVDEEAPIDEEVPAAEEAPAGGG